VIICKRGSTNTVDTLTINLFVIYIRLIIIVRLMKSIVINLGERGVILSLIRRTKVLKFLSIDKLEPGNLKSVVDFLIECSGVSASMLLDIGDQTFSHKVFPSLNYFELREIVERKFELEIPKTFLKRKIFLYKNDQSNKLTFLFASINTDSPVREWIKLFKNMPNDFVGVYSTPIELVELAKVLVLATQYKSNVERPNNWIFINVNNKISAIRQVAIFNNKIAFSRLIEYPDTKSTSFDDFMKRDISMIFGQIKTFNEESSSEKIIVINIFSPEQKDILNKLQINDVVILNYTPCEVAEKLHLGSLDDNKSSDMLLSLFVSKHGGQVKFENRNIHLSHALKSYLALLNALILFFIVSIVLCVTTYGILHHVSGREIAKMQNTLEQNKRALLEKSTKELEEDPENIYKIIDLAAIKEKLGTYFLNPIKDFKKFFAVQSGLATHNKLEWSAENPDYQNDKIHVEESEHTTVKISYSVDMSNTNNDLLSKYNTLRSRLDTAYKNSSFTITPLPNDTKYDTSRTYPVKIDIVGRK